MILDEIEAEQSREQRREQQPTHTPPSSPPLMINEPWSSPSTFSKLAKQADAIQQLLRSSVEPPEPAEKRQIRQNVTQFMTTVKAKDIVSGSLTDYVWESSIA